MRFEMVAENSLSSPYHVINHVFLVYGNIILLVVLVSACTCCYKRKKNRSIIRDDDCDCEMGSDLSLAETPLLGEDSNTIELPSPTGEKFYIQPSTKLTRTLTSRPGSRFRKTPAQPAYEDLAPFAVPDEIPEAPSGLHEDLGTIYFSISYDIFTLALKVHVQKAQGLPAKDVFGTSDPYVRVHLHPSSNAHKLQTRTRMRDLNPVWNEVLSFEDFSHDKLLEKSLMLNVFDYDRFSKDDEIGETEVVLGNIALQREPVDFEKQLRPCKHSRGYLGDLLISLAYHPSTSSLFVIIMKGSRLKPVNLNGKSDPYVKLYLRFKGKRIDKKVTPVRRNTVNPVWNQVFQFEAPIDRIRSISLCFKVKDFENVFPNKLIGTVMVGSHLGGSSLKHWTDMLNKPRKAIALWHTIVK